MKDKIEYIHPLNDKEFVRNEKMPRPGRGKAEKDGTGRTRSRSPVHRSREELRSLAARLQSVREEERRALSRELHDNLGQALTAMKLDLHWMDRHASHISDALTRKEMLDKTREFKALIEAAITTIHRISTDLRPSILDELGLWPALESEVSRFASRTGIECVVRPCSTLHRSLDEGISLAIFRIVQEALTNIARHARATVVEISCTLSDNCHILSIVDNGRGITAAEAGSPRSLGLIGIRERALGFGGEFTIDRAGAEGGTRVSVRLPANNLKKDT